MALSKLVTIPIRAGSDGNVSTWPGRGLRRDDPHLYLSKIATRWVNDSGRAEPGKRYTFDKLPPGYALFAKARDGDPKSIDRYLYGHPKYRFRSSEEFYEHFKNLMDHGSFDNCACFGCKAKPRHRNPIVKDASGTVKRKVGRPAGQPRQAREIATPPISTVAFDSSLLDSEHEVTRPAPRKLTHNFIVDEEGTTDIYHALTEKLKDRLTVDEAILEETSFDWKIDRGHIKRLLTSIKTQPHFLPRLGEIVLFMRGLAPGDSIVFDDETKKLEVWSTRQNASKDSPEWEAGLVTQLPQTSVGIKDLTNATQLHHDSASCGYLIEPMSEVGSDEKSWTKRKAYVPLHQIRPFAFYKEFLKGTKASEYHPTVINSLEIMSSFSLVERYHFRGLWPSATVFSRGLYLGPELLMVGDTVRLRPATDHKATEISDIMRITSFKLKLIHLDAADNPEYDNVDGMTKKRDAAFDSCLHISGVAFTKDPVRAWGSSRLPTAVAANIVPKGTAGYGDWYNLHDPSKRWEIPFSQVVGRCFEAEALQQWFYDYDSPKILKDTTPVKSTSLRKAFSQPSSQNSLANKSVADISKGFTGIEAARKLSRNRDTRIDTSNGKTWFWADSRVEQLDLHEVRNVTVTSSVNGKPVREPQAWMRALLIRQKGPGFRTKLTLEEQESYHHASVAVKPRGRPTNASKSLLAASAAGAELEGTSSESETTPGLAGLAGEQVVASSNEDEEVMDAVEEPRNVGREEPVQRTAGLHRLADMHEALGDSSQDSDGSAGKTEALLKSFQSRRSR